MFLQFTTSLGNTVAVNFDHVTHIIKGIDDKATIFMAHDAGSTDLDYRFDDLMRALAKSSVGAPRALRGL